MTDTMNWSPRIYHRAKHISEDGSVSALCYKRPRKINLTRFSWTMRNDAVTCPKCRKIIDNTPTKAVGA